MFQFTRPRGARRGVGFQSRTPECFNSRAREGRDLRWLQGVRTLLVSIHAPARGATRLACVRCSAISFQFTRPRGARRQQVFPPLRVVLVSIHAPARGATQQTECCQCCWCFNSRAREGRDADKTARKNAIKGFNSRAREGRDFGVVCRLPGEQVSIHAPARGATKIRGGGTPVLSVSIHAPARGATPGS